MKKKYLRREVIKLELNSDKKPHMIRVPGPRPYIWIGIGNDIVGCVSDRSIRKLKRWCEEILSKND